MDDCNGDWDYTLDCDPYYYTCCVPHHPITTDDPTITEETTTPYTGPTRSTTTQPTPEPGCKFDMYT